MDIRRSDGDEPRRTRRQPSGSSSSHDQLMIENASESDDRSSHFSDRDGQDLGNPRFRRMHEGDQVDTFPFQSPDDVYKIVIIGMKRTGKSSVANTIIGREEFPVGNRPWLPQWPITRRCQSQTVQIHGKKLKIIDTPGMDSAQTGQQLEKNLIDCLKLCTYGPHIILWVIDASTECSQVVYTRYYLIKKMFGDQISKYIRVAFTKEDVLKRRGSDVSTMLETLQKADRRRTGVGESAIRRILQDTKFRYVTFNNRGTENQKRDEVDKFLQMLTDLVEDNRPMTHFAWHGFHRSADDVEQEAVQRKQRETVDVNPGRAKEAIERDLKRDQSSNKLGRALAIGAAVAGAGVVTALTGGAAIPLVCVAGVATGGTACTGTLLTSTGNEDAQLEREGVLRSTSRKAVAVAGTVAAVGALTILTGGAFAVVGAASATAFGAGAFAAIPTAAAVSTVTGSTTVLATLTPAARRNNCSIM